MQKDIIKINHLYSNNLNIYGDLGNIYALKARAKLFDLQVENFSNQIGDRSIDEADIYLIGGGQDKDQLLVFEDLLMHKDFIKNEVEKGKVFILICGGYQLFGMYFLDAKNNLIEGLGILDIETKAPDSSVASRCIGNLIVEMSPDFINHWGIATSFSKYLVGFENHGGQTFFSEEKKVCPIGKVISGFGNNSTEKLEGASYKNIIGTYMHGSLLPKNPHLTDAIIRKVANLSIDSDNNWDLEQKAHEYILKQLKIKN
jgi:CobQ-like glutamine amidotransferase family enzyme